MQLKNSKTTYLGKTTDRRYKYALDGFIGAVQMSVDFTVLPRNVGEASKHQHVAKLSPKATDNEIEDAFAKDLRTARRSLEDYTKSVKSIFQLAQHILGRRLPK